MVEPFQQWLESACNICKIHHPTGLSAYGPVDVQYHAEGMTVQPCTFMVFRDVGQPVRGLEGELFEYLHLGDPKIFMGLKAEAPEWVCEAVLNRTCSVGVAVGPVHRLQEEVLEAELVDLGRAKEGCGKTSFSSLPWRRTSCAPALGLTQIQSMPEGGSQVPLVSMAILNSRS